MLQLQRRGKRDDHFRGHLEGVLSVMFLKKIKRPQKLTCKIISGPTYYTNKNIISKYYY